MQASEQRTQTDPTHGELRTQRQEPHGTVASLKARAAEGIDGAASTVGQRVQEAGERMKRVGEAIADTGEATGARVKRAGEYCAESTPESLQEDLKQLVARHPGIAMLAGIGVGAFVMRLVSRGRG